MKIPRRWEKNLLRKKNEENPIVIFLTIHIFNDICELNNFKNKKCYFKTYSSQCDTHKKPDTKTVTEII